MIYGNSKISTCGIKCRRHFCHAQKLAGSIASLTKRITVMIAKCLTAASRFCSTRFFSAGWLNSRGQAAVEMAVVMPALLAVVGITINLMVYLGDCACFDRVAAEAVRTQAASPGFGEYGSASRASAVQAELESSFAESEYLSFSVEVQEESAVSVSNDATTAGGVGSGNPGIGFSLLPHKEIYTCTMYYQPWGFGEQFLDFEFTGIPHKRSFLIDPYRPGVML